MSPTGRPEGEYRSAQRECSPTGAPPSAAELDRALVRALAAGLPRVPRPYHAVAAALGVPAADFERVAAEVNAFPEVAHNYAREHALNMWFVLATPAPADVGPVLAAIERATGLPVLAFPKEREYGVHLFLAA